jgi:ribonuclease P protein component
MTEPKRKTLRLTFGRDHRLKGRTAFDRVYRLGKKRTFHPLVGSALPRETAGVAEPAAPTRLGISIGRKCGTAVERNKIKRRIREAFRLHQHQLPNGRDVMIIVRPHKVLEVAAYAERLRNVIVP